VVDSRSYHFDLDAIGLVAVDLNNRFLAVVTAEFVVVVVAVVGIENAKAVDHDKASKKC
jgi:hypothetical protein